MLQQPAPEDFVLATGETHPVREFVEKAFAELDIQIKYVVSFRSLLYQPHASLQGGGVLVLVRRGMMPKLTESWSRLILGTSVQRRSSEYKAPLSLCTRLIHIA